MPTGKNTPLLPEGINEAFPSCILFFVIKCIKFYTLNAILWDVQNPNYQLTSFFCRTRRPNSPKSQNREPKRQVRELIPTHFSSLIFPASLFSPTSNYRLIKLSYRSGSFYVIWSRLFGWNVSASYSYLNKSQIKKTYNYERYESLINR